MFSLKLAGVILSELSVKLVEEIGQKDCAGDSQRAAQQVIAALKRHCADNTGASKI